MAELVSAATAARVAASLREEMGALDRVVGLIAEAVDALPEDREPGVVVVHGVGGLVHDFYTGIESGFRHVSPDLNGHVPGGEAWHRELLHAMTLELPEVRPAVLSTSAEAALIPFLKFRHLYRNMYGFRLEWKRVRELATEVGPTWAAIRGELERFLSFLEALVAARA